MRYCLIVDELLERAMVGINTIFTALSEVFKRSVVRAARVVECKADHL